MNVNLKYIVAFAGPVGCSKTPIAFYLSSKFSLPIYNSDAIRTEVTEDFLEFDEDEFAERRDKRLKEILETGHSFILDASIDRIMRRDEENVSKLGYKYFLISIDLSKEFLIRLYKAKGYSESLEKIDQFLSDHENFLTEFINKVNLHITDNEFSDRLRVSEQALSKWLDNNSTS